MGYVLSVKLHRIKELRLYLAVGIGGMIGSCLRYLVSLLFQLGNVSEFPWATLTVNMSGAFLLTFLLFHPVIKSKLSPIVFTAMTTGLVGSYTTFSTITVETVMLWQVSYVTASVYIFLTFIGGLFCSYLGYKIACQITKERGIHS